MSGLAPNCSPSRHSQVQSATMGSTRPTPPDWKDQDSALSTVFVKVSSHASKAVQLADKP
eukprot:4694755-Lingulodinium_polyedra.AAC.1